jgi:hypothetical protein
MPTQTCSWRKGGVTLYNGGRGGLPVPGPDGQVVYTDDGRYTPQLRPLGREGIYSWPAHHGPYYLSLPVDKKDRLDVYLAGVSKPLVSLDDVDVAGAPPRAPGVLPLDKRIHLIPDAQLLVGRGEGHGWQPHGHHHLSKAIPGMRCGNYGKSEKIGCMGRIGYIQHLRSCEGVLSPIL